MIFGLSEFCGLVSTVVVILGIAGLAPRARHSFATAQKSAQKRPPQQLRPVKGTGFPFSHYRYHAVPELAKNAQTCWHRKPMITVPAKWLAEVDKVKVKSGV